MTTEELVMETEKDLIAAMQAEPVEAEDNDESVVPNFDDGSDLLLKQIDAFRDKAKQLQNLINAKEHKVKELEALVRAKEEKNRLLQEENQKLQEQLNHKKDQANELVRDVEEQVDRMLQSLGDNFDEIGQQISQQVAHNQEESSAQTKKVGDALDHMDEILGQIRTDVADAKTAVADVSEKVHSEGVSIYRNIQSLLKEMDHSEEQKETMNKGFGSLRSKLNAITVFSLVNFAGLVVVILYLFGII